MSGGGERFRAVAAAIEQRIDAPRRQQLAVALSLAALLVPIGFALVSRRVLTERPGVDFLLYRDVAERWLSGAPLYGWWQLSGPYAITAGDSLYPPIGLWLFVPFVALPAVLWWAIPIGLTVWALQRLRPRPEVWPLLVLCAVWPTTILKIWTGNPVIWTVAAMSLATVYRWPSVFVLLKASLFPFALFGAHRRSWRIALLVALLLSLPFGRLWLDWLAAVANSRGGGLLYSVLEIPMLLLPLVAWFGRTREGGGSLAFAWR